MNLLEKLSDILEENITEDMDFTELDTCDSLGILSIVAMVDKEYGVTITAQDFINIRTAKDLESLIASKK